MSKQITISNKAIYANDESELYDFAFMSEVTYEVSNVA